MQHVEMAFLDGTYSLKKAKPTHSKAGKYIESLTVRTYALEKTNQEY